MPGQCSNAVKAARAREAAAVAEKMKCTFLNSQIGLVLPVLFESSPSAGSSTGHSDNYLLVSTDISDLRGEVRQVRIRQRNNETLYGDIV